MKLTTTFNLLREARACTAGYRKLAQHLGGVEAYGAEEEIDLLTILDSNGFDDAVWCLRATKQDKQQADRTKRLIACDFAESVLHIFESKRPGDNRPRRSVEVSRLFADGQATSEELGQARKESYAAYAAAYAADAYAAYAAYAAAYAADAYAAAYAAYAAAADAADADAADAARQTKKTQLAEILRSHLS